MRLRKSTGATGAGSIRISIWADRLSIKYDAYPLVAVFIGGEPIKWKLVEELVFDVSAKANGEAISLTFRADDSERTIVYRSVGQQLVTETIIASPQFSTPLRYTIVYNRAN